MAGKSNRQDPLKPGSDPGAPNLGPGVTRLILLRHAETSAPELYHGAESDVGLGPRGLDQASAVARALAELRPDVVGSSTLRRARQTAEVIARACGRPVEVVPGLQERRMGALSGTPREQGRDLYERTKAQWMAGDLGFTHPGAESYAQVRQRAVPAIERVVRGRTGQTIVLVSHGVTIRVVLTSLLEEFGPSDFQQVGIDFVAWNELTWDGQRWRALRLNWRPSGVA